MTNGRPTPQRLLTKHTPRIVQCCEVYDNGQITSQKKFYVQPSFTLGKLKLTNEKKFLPNEIGQGLLIKRIESLLEKYNI